MSGDGIIRSVYDVAVVGAGPAGMAAAIGAREGGARSVLLVDRDERLGGILPQCVHAGFGLKVFGRELTGPEYSERYAARLAGLDVDVLLDASVVGIDSEKRITVSSPATGVRSVRARAVVLAMGCRERTRGNIRVPGFRPAGILTAGTAQRLINREAMMVGEKIVVVGSGDIGLIMARRCTLEGARVEAVIEKLPYPSGLNRNVVQCLGDFRIPLHLGHEVTFIEGVRRVEGVRIAGVGAPASARGTRVECDTVLLSVGLIPEIELLLGAGVPVDPGSGGPVVDQMMHTRLDGFFAAGNLVQVYDIVDWVSIEGERAGRGAAAYAAVTLGARLGRVRFERGPGVKSVVPQELCDYGGGGRGAGRLYIRVGAVLKKPVFRFVGPAGAVREVKKPYAVPSELVECDLSGIVGEAFGNGVLTVEAVERGVRDAETREPLHGSAASSGSKPNGAARAGSGGAPRGAQSTVSVTCVLCPESCLVRVSPADGEAGAEGAKCARGGRYAVREAKDPRRTFTSSVRVLGGGRPVCPVRTTRPIRKDDWKRAMTLVGVTAARAPIRFGETVVRDFLEPGIRLIATDSVAARNSQ